MTNWKRKRKTTYQWQRKWWRESLVLKARPCLRFHFHRGERKSRWYRRGRGAGRRWGWSIQWSRAPPSRKVLDWQIIRLKMMAIWLWTKEAHNCTYLEVAATAEVVEGWALAHYEDFLGSKHGLLSPSYLKAAIQLWWWQLIEIQIGREKRESVGIA